MTDRPDIRTCLWFDDQAEQAARFYASIFDDSRVLESTPYVAETPSDKPVGSVMTVDFELAGRSFTALNGGPAFELNPSISFFVHCKTADEVDEIWEELADGGTPVMPLDSYPFSEKYGWIQDKYGVTWQVMLADDEVDDKIVPSLMFVGDHAGQAEEAIRYYVEVFDDSQVGDIARYGADQEHDEEGTVVYADFTLAGQSFAAMDSGYPHQFGFNEAISLMVECENQDEIDYFWEKLSASPEAEQCGWLKDRFGVSWQVVPSGLDAMLRDEHKERARRVVEAFLPMKKLDIATLEQAFDA